MASDFLLVVANPSQSGRGKLGYVPSVPMFSSLVVAKPFPKRARKTRVRPVCPQVPRPQVPPDGTVPILGCGKWGTSRLSPNLSSERSSARSPALGAAENPAFRVTTARRWPAQSVGIDFNPDAPGALIGHAFDLNLDCLWSLAGCRDWNQLLPAVEDRGQ
jgi:hypothetical protein